MARKAKSMQNIGSDSSISLEAEVPEALFDGMKEFIRAHPHWDQYSVITSALAAFLVQNGLQDQAVSQHCFDAIDQRQ
jgi:hypothetical protein